MQSRRGIQQLRLLLNQPAQWAEEHDPSSLCVARVWAALAKETIRIERINASRGKSANQRRADRRERSMSRGPSTWAQERMSDREIRREEKARSEVIGILPRIGLPAGTTVTGEQLRNFRVTYVDSIVRNIKPIILARLAWCPNPGCARVFLRARSEKAQKYCERCRRRWVPQTLARLVHGNSPNERSPIRGVVGQASLKALS